MSAAETWAGIGADLPEPLRLLVREELGSTNDEARALAEAGAADGLVVVAERQTAGRGRRGAAWFSPPGESLAFSLVVRPAEPKSMWPRLALAAGLAVAEVLERHGLMAGIKWPNDVWVGRRKIAGVLIEAGRDFAVIGIGLNVNTRDFPPGVAEIATSLALETGEAVCRAEVLAAVLRRLEWRRRQIGAEFPALLDAVRHRCVLTGNPVRLSTAAGPRHGRVDGIGAAGELLLRTPAGVEAILQADEIRLCAPVCGDDAGH
jgi:BirA family biotin operon repressor/biotin-[acetyl-CoA-carboxylase] ligase